MPLPDARPQPTEVTVESLPTVLKWTVTIFAALLIVLHAILPVLAIDQTTVWLLLLAILPWIVHLIESLTFPGGGGVKFHHRSEKAKGVAIDKDIAEDAARSGQPPELASPTSPSMTARRTDYLRSEAEALAALSEVIAPAWELITNQIAEFPRGIKVEADAVIRGPRGYRPVLVEAKILQPNRDVSDAVNQLAAVLGRAAATAKLAGQRYEPMLLWVARQWSVDHRQKILRAVAPTVAATGSYLAIYNERAATIEFAFLLPHFVLPTARVVTDQ